MIFGCFFCCVIRVLPLPQLSLNCSLGKRAWEELGWGCGEGTGKCNPACPFVQLEGLGWSLPLLGPPGQVGGHRNCQGGWCLIRPRAGGFQDEGRRIPG